MNPFIKYNEILRKYLKPNISTLYQLWNDPKRKYHNMEHLEKILIELEKSRDKVLPLHWDALVLAAFFHDAIYVTGRKDNEAESMIFFFRSYNNTDYWLAQKVGFMIDATKSRKIPMDDYLVKIFWEADNEELVNGGLDTLKKNEEKIRAEFPQYSDSVYKKGRMEFINSCIGLYGKKTDENLSRLKEYIEEKYKS